MSIFLLSNMVDYTGHIYTSRFPLHDTHALHERLSNGYYYAGQSMFLMLQQLSF